MIFDVVFWYKNPNFQSDMTGESMVELISQFHQYNSVKNSPAFRSIVILDPLRLTDLTSLLPETALTQIYAISSTEFRSEG